MPESILRRCALACGSLVLAFASVSLTTTANAQAMTVEINRYEVSGNTLLPEATVAQALGTTPARVEFAEIQRAAETLQEAYRAAGYGAVVVLIPEQKLQDGVVHLQVIEGRLSQIMVAGIQAFSQDNILRSLPSLELGKTPSLKALDRELLMANENPAKTMRIVFQPGERESDVEALAVVEEQPLVRWHGVLDNTGTPGTGEARVTLGYQHANVMDRDLVLGLQASTSPTHPSKVQIFGATLRAPLYARHVFLEGSLLSSNTSNVTNATPAGDLRFSGKGQALGLRAVWMLPTLSETKAQLSIGVDARRYDNDCSLGEFGAAGCGGANAAVSVLPLTLGYQAQHPGRWAAHVEWVSNLPWGAAGKNGQFNASRPGANSHYQLLRAGASAQHLITSDWTLSWRAQAQWALAPLVSAEQLGTGGASNVRGYLERELSTDSGMSASVELTTALPVLYGGTRTARDPMISAFVDGAILRNRAGMECRPARTRCNLWSVGLGVLLHPADNTFIRIEAARAGQPASRTSAGDWRWHLSMSHLF